MPSEILPLRPRKAQLGAGLVIGSAPSWPETPPRASSPRQMSVSVRCSGPVCAVQLSARFQLQLEEAQPMTFLFPLPEGAAVTHFRAQVGSRRLQGHVEPWSGQSHRAFELSPPARTLLAEEEEPVFMVALGPVESGAEILVELAYAEAVPRAFGGYRWAFPSGAAPGVSVRLQLENGYRLLRAAPGGRTGRLDTGDTLLEQKGADFFLEYTEDEHPPTLHAGARHFYLRLGAEGSAPAARQLIVLLDASENARGEAGEACRDTVREVLRQLRPGETFSLVGFSDDLAGYRDGSACPSQEAEAAVAWLETLRCRGQAQLATLWRRILQLPPTSNACVLLIVAGPVGHELPLYQELCQERFCGRIFTIGYGPRANHQFLRAVAQRTRASNYRWSPGVAEAVAAESSRPPCSPPLEDRGLRFIPESCHTLNVPGEGALLLGFKQGSGGLALEGQALPPRPCQNPALGLVWANHKLRALEDEMLLSSGPRASQLRPIVGALAREYRLLTQDSRFVVHEEGGEEPCVLPSPYSRSWLQSRVRLYEPRFRAAPPPPSEELGLEPPVVRRRGETPLTAPPSTRGPIHVLEPPRVRHWGEDPPHAPPLNRGPIPVRSGLLRGAGSPLPPEPRTRLLPKPTGKADMRVSRRPAPIVRRETRKPLPPIRPRPDPASAPTGSGGVAVAEPALDPLQQARQLLRAHEGMKLDLRALYRALTENAPPAVCSGLAVTVLQRLQPLAAQSTVLREGLRTGQARLESLRAAEPGGREGMRDWLHRLASLF